MSGLSGRPLQFTQTNPLLVFEHPLIDVVFEPSLFGCHLRPQDAPARACADRALICGFPTRRAPAVGLRNVKTPASRSASCVRRHATGDRIPLVRYLAAYFPI